jgi:hypothetical protein
VRAWVSTGFHDATPIPPGSVPGLRVGVGVYGAVAQERVAGANVPTVVESRGHMWRLTTTAATTTGAPVHPPAAAADRIASVVWRTHGHTRVTVRAGSQTPTGSSSPGGGGALPDLWVPAGAALRASVTGGTGSVGVAFYERTD